MLCHTLHMTSAQSPTPVMRRRLGGMLRHYRNESAMTLAQAASCVGWESTRLSRVETGQYQIKEREVSKLLEVYGVNAPEVIAELTRAAESSVRAWWSAYSDILP